MLPKTEVIGIINLTQFHEKKTGQSVIVSSLDNEIPIFTIVTYPGIEAVTLFLLSQAPEQLLFYKFRKQEDAILNLSEELARGYVTAKRTQTVSAYRKARSVPYPLREPTGGGDLIYPKPSLPAIVYRDAKKQGADVKYSYLMKTDLVPIDPTEMLKLNSVFAEAIMAGMRLNLRDILNFNPDARPRA